jgi:seryl-tRNA synthetase
MRYSSEPQTYGAPPASQESKADLEAKWNRAKEWVELLNVKMLALQQQMAQAGNDPPKDQIQKDINDLTQRIQQAQADEKKAKDDLDKFSASQTQKK